MIWELFVPDVAMETLKTLEAPSRLYLTYLFLFTPSSMISFILKIYLIFILLDISFNVISDKLFVRKEIYTLLLLYVLQDACILMSLTLISFSLFRTNVFKYGFMVLLLERFKLTLISALIYILITVALQIDILYFRWSDPYNWKYGIGILYLTQRTVAVFYYYFVKRSALRLSDPRFYDEEWVKHAVNHDPGGK